MKLMLLSFSIDPFCLDPEHYYQSQYIRGHITSLENAGWEVDVFTDSGAQNTISVQSISPLSRIIRIPAREGRESPQGDVYTNLPDLLATIKKWVREKGLSYPLIQSDYWLSGWLGRQLQQDWSIPHVHTPFELGINHVGIQEVNRYSASGRRIIEETKTFASADAVVVASPEERELIWRRYGLRSVDVQINACSIDTSLFNIQGGPKAARARGKRIILYTGGLHAQGGMLHTMIDSLRELLDTRPKIARTIELWILGNPPVQTLRESMDAQQLGQLAHVLAYGEFVRFLGMPEPEKIAQFYRAADVCIVPSAIKGSGIAALEAMASGCPVIAPRADWLRSVVLDGETGLLVPEGDSHGLAQILERLLTKPGLRRRMGERAAHWVREGFNHMSIGKRWNNIYREVLHEHERDRSLETSKAKQLCC